MGDCGITFDPAQTRAAIDACIAIAMQPDSGANFARGALLVSVLGLVVIAVVWAVTRGIAR